MQNFKQFGRSFLYIKNNKGPKIVPSRIMAPLTHLLSRLIHQSSIRSNKVVTVECKDLKSDCCVLIRLLSFRYSSYIADRK